MSEDVSTLRLYLMRIVYLGNFVMLGIDVWPRILSHQKQWDALQGVAFSFWAALSTLSALGIRYPLAMLPLLLLQLFYKSVWLIAVAVPLHSAGRSSELTSIFIAGAVADLIVIPWRYVVAHYIQRRGDRWM